MLPVVLEEFDIVYIFWLLFTFHYYCQLVNGHLLQKSGWGDCSPQAPPPSPTGFYGPVYGGNVGLYPIRF